MMQQQSISKCGNYNLDFINEIPVSTMDQFKVLDYFIQHNQSLNLWIEFDYKNIIQNKYSKNLRSFFVAIDKYNQTKDLVLQLSMESGINKLLDTLKVFIDDIDEEIKTIKKENDKNIALKNETQFKMQNQYEKKVLPIIHKLEKELENIQSLSPKFGKYGIDIKDISKVKDLSEISKYYRNLDLYY